VDRALPRRGALGLAVRTRETCAHCGHTGYAHDNLGLCDLCPCVHYQSEVELAEDAAMDREPWMLNNDEEDDAA
jgi:hypothetical protein